MIVEPKTYLIGYTTIDWQQLLKYLEDTGQEEFYDEAAAARDDGVSAGEILCSFYAKLCYKSLVMGKNENLTKIRGIKANLGGVFDSGHGAVFEHAWLNFVTTNCSRVFTHELVRHRVGTAFSQTSGRYVSIDEIDMILPPELEPVRVEAEAYAKATAAVCRQFREKLIPPDADLATKKRITSAIRRIAPNGQSNEIGWSVNIRALRHLIELRTSRHAEWEIRRVFNDVAAIILDRWPGILYGHSTNDTNDGMYEYINLHV